LRCVFRDFGSLCEYNFAVVLTSTERLPFVPGQPMRRTEIHSRFGGSGGGGIASSARFPFIFIFSGSQGQKHGYQDGWIRENKVFTYSGEGQLGDMKFMRGNLALRDHLKNGKRVFLFEYIKKGIVKFNSELVLFDVGYFEALDLNKNLRQAIRFFFHPVGVRVQKAYEPSPPVSVAADPASAYREPNVTERTGLVTSRVGQGAYRKSILYRWDQKCAVTGFHKPEILIASHILPWKESSDIQRLDVDNGILLSPVYDALFDRHLISFEDSGSIILSDKIEMSAYAKIGVSGEEKVRNLTDGNRSYLNKHREFTMSYKST